MRREHPPATPPVDRFGLGALLRGGEGRTRSDEAEPGEAPPARVRRPGQRRASGSARSPRAGAPPPPVEPAAEPPKVVEGSVLRLEAGNLEGMDALDLRFALLRLPGVTAAGIDLAAGLVDLSLGPGTHVLHVLNLARARAGLRLQGAELHRPLAPGERLGAETLIQRLE